MNYTIIGASGNTGSIVANELLNAGHETKLITRSANKLANLKAKGAHILEGDLTDESFLTKSFDGSDAVYALIPPNFGLQESWRVYMRRIGTAITNALEKSGVKNVVILSSMGAHLRPFGAGPVSGLGEWEEQLKTVKNLNVLSLRPGFFMQNFFGNINLIKHTGFFGYNLAGDVKSPLVHTTDIGHVAANRLLALDFEGFEIQYIGGAKDYSMNEVAAILGAAINKTDLKYIAFSDEDSKQGMLSAGLPETIADNYVELFKGISSGKYYDDFNRNEKNTTATTLEEFARQFAAVYNN